MLTFADFYISLLILLFISIPIFSIFFTIRRKDLKFRRILFSFSLLSVALTIGIINNYHLIKQALVNGPFNGIPIFIAILLIIINLIKGYKEIINMPSKSAFLWTQNSLNKAIQKYHKASALAMKQQERINRIIEYSPVSKIIIDGDLKILGFNPAFLEYTGYTKQELNDLSILDLIKSDERKKKIITNSLKVMDKDKVEFNLHFQRKDGEIVHGKLIGSLFQETEMEERHSILQILDYTSEIKFSLKMKNLNKILQEKVAEQTKAIVKQNKNLTYLNHAMSHDLKAPIKTIEGLFEAYVDLERTKDLAAKKECATYIQQNILRANKLVDELNMFFKVQKNVLKKEAYNPTNQIIEIIDSFKNGMFKNLNIDVKMTQLPIINVDRKVFYHVWQNLIGNALKYASKRPVIQLTIESYCKHGSTYFLIIDNGVGFSDTEKIDLFKPFKRLSSATDFMGTGLGLPIVKEILDRHNAKIWAESKLNEGSTFYIMIPKEYAMREDGLNHYAHSKELDATPLPIT